MILIALGANLPSQFGSPKDTLEAVIPALEGAGVQIVSRSSIWVTEPVPKSDQPLYRNAVICVKTELGPHALLELLHATEASFGRVREERNEARVLDLDLLVYNDVVTNADDGLSIPHPRMHERAFVLMPLLEFISAQWKHPTLKKNVTQMLELLPDQSFKSSMRICA